MKFFEKNYVKYGLYLTGVVMLCLAVMEFTGLNETFEKSPLAFFWSVIAPAIILFLGLSAKKKIQKGKLTYKQGLLEGIKISFVFGLVSPFVFMFYYLAVNPEILSFVKEAYRIPNASNDVAIVTDMGVQFIASIVGGTVYAAIISFFVKSKKK